MLLLSAFVRNGTSIWKSEQTSRSVLFCTLKPSLLTIMERKWNDRCSTFFCKTKKWQFNYSLHQIFLQVIYTYAIRRKKLLILYKTRLCPTQSFYPRWIEFAFLVINKRRGRPKPDDFLSRNMERAGEYFSLKMLCVKRALLVIFVSLLQLFVEKRTLVDIHLRPYDSLHDSWWSWRSSFYPIEYNHFSLLISIRS